jgi:predicted ferric reductase
MKYKRFLIYLIIFILAIIPVFLVINNATGKFSDYKSATHTLGQIAGLVGMTLFAINFILSTRIKFIEDGFNGLDKVYVSHGLLGGTALILVLFHPLLLVLNFIPENISLAAHYLLPNTYWSVNFGIIALLSLIFLIYLTLYTRIKYQKWKFSHEFLGVVFIFAVLHIFLIRGTIAQDNIFRGYFVYAIIVSLIGLGGFFYSLFLRNKFSSRTLYAIKEINKKNLGVYELVLAPEYAPLKYKAGQFVFLSFKNKKIGKEPHPFSIASSSNNILLKVVIKNLGDFTSQLPELKVGDKVYVEGPYGRFNYNKTGKDQIWIAGGIGITPFLGMAEDMGKNTNIKNQVELYYSANGEEEFVGLKELKEFALKNKNLKIITWNTEVKGYIKVDNIFQMSKELRDKEFYICGPEGLKQSMIKGLLKEGIKEKDIHMEEFKFR